MATVAELSAWRESMSPPKKLKAVIFSCHNTKYYENTIEPKLERYNVETIRKIDPNRSPAIDLSGCDVAIILLELMPAQHISRIKNHCKKELKDYLELRRQISDWDRAFARKEDKLVAGAQKPINPREPGEPRLPLPRPISPSAPAATPPSVPPPPSSRRFPPPATKVAPPQWGAEKTTDVVTRVRDEAPQEEETEIEGISEEYAQYLSLVEEENQTLSKKVRELEANWKRAQEEHQKVVEKNITLDTKNKELMERIKLAETTAAKHQAELAKLKHEHSHEVNELQELLKKAGEELDKMGKVMKNDLEDALKHFRGLWDIGMMTGDEILQKLFKWKK